MTVTDTHTGASRRRGFSAWAPRVTLALGAAGVVFGVVGYRQFPTPLPWPDAIYSGIQLIALASSNPPDGSPAPVALQVGRFLTALALGSAVLLVLARFGVVGRDRLRASTARGHRVVIGATPEAQQLAVASRVSGATPATPTVTTTVTTVLIGAVVDDDAARLRASGVVVVAPAGERRLDRVLSGAVDVVVAEDDDLDALGTLGAVRSSTGLSPDTSLRVLLRSAPLAGTLQATAGTNPTITSLAQAVALNLCTDRFPTRIDGTWHHVIVAGDGDHAEELSIAAVLPWAVEGESIDVDLVGASTGEWMPSARARMAGVAEAHVHQCAATPSSFAAAVERCCDERHGPHLVFVAGLAPADAVAVGVAVARSQPDSRVVSVLARGAAAVTTDLDGADMPANWSPQYVGRLLDDRNLLRFHVVERLGHRLLDELGIWRSAHCGDQLAAMLGRTSVDAPGDVDRTNADAAARTLLDEFAAHGCIAQAALRPDLPTTPGPETMIAIARSLQVRLPRPAGFDAQRWQMLVTRLTFRVPRLLATLGYVLVDDAPAPSAADEIELLARAVHQRYRDHWNVDAPASASTLATKTWDELTAAQQEANRAQARDIAVKLACVGKYAAPGGPGTVNSNGQVNGWLFDDAMVEQFAIDEHDRWMRQKIETGWSWGEPRDDARKIHPSIVPWTDLSEAQRDLDRQPVRNIPELLQMIGARLLDA